MIKSVLPRERTPQSATPSITVEPEKITPNAMEPLGFARYIAWVTLLLVLLLSCLLSTYLGNTARTTLMAKQKEFSALLAENLNHQIYRRFTLPTILGFGRIALRQTAVYERLDNVVQSTIHGLHVEHLRIFGHDQVITYSTITDELGKDELAHPSITAASASSDDAPIFDIDSAVPYWKAFFSFSLDPGAFILRTTYPLRMENRLTSSEDEGPLMGVLEFTRDITPDMLTAIRFQQLIVVVTLMSSGLMVILLLLFIRRAERVISTRMAEERRLQVELLQHEKLAGMGRVIASIAHEIRNPLGIIRSSAELLLKRSTSSQDTGTTRILQAIFDEARRLSQTVSDFLDYARPRQIKQVQVNLSGVISQALAFLEPEFASRKIHAEYSDLTNAQALVLGDTDMLYRAFYNIMSNAIQAMKNTGILRITLASAPATGETPTLRIVFHDSGDGFAAETLPHILDPFFTTKDDGTGLGLPIVSSIITSHGGSLTLENAPTGGALVIVTLPAQMSSSLLTL